MFRYMQNCPIYFGPGAIDHLGEYVSELGCKKAFCVYDPGVEAVGVPARAVASLEKAGIHCVCFNKIMSDPTIQVVDEAGKIALREQVDVIIGIGGGSSMDAAKAISILMTNPGPISKYVLAKPITVDTKVPVVSVPTTAGTGSEATRVAIITQTETGGKWSVFVNTALAVVDPEITFGLPRNVTAFTGLDALSHAAECVTSNVTNPHNQLLACAAIRKIFDNLYTAWSEPDNVEARTEMALAANWAGIAFAETMCHVGHALADGLSIAFHTPHGYNCALALPVALEYAAPAVPKEIRMVAEAMRIPLRGDESGEELGRLCAEQIRALMRRLEVKSLKDMGYSREEVLQIAEEGATSHLSTYCPVPVTREAALEMAGRMYDEYQ